MLDTIDTIDPVDVSARLYDGIQRDFPLTERPYQDIAERYGLCEHSLLAMLARDIGDGRISRLGAVFAPNVIGASTLAALAVPPAMLDRVARRVSNDPAVSHNYARGGSDYNLWFVAGARDRGTLDITLEAIAADVGLTPLDLPLEREYHIDLGFPLGGHPGPTGHRGNQRTPSRPVPRTDLDAAGWRLVAALEDGLPLALRPYHELARRCGMNADAVIDRLTQWQSSGLVRRFGVVLQHRRFGYGHNAMCVWDVPDGRADAFGLRLTRVPGVNLCYRRSRRLPDWPYNLYAMVHARTDAQLQAALTRFRTECGLGSAPGLVLRGTHCYKQCGTRYASHVALPPLS